MNLFSAPDRLTRLQIEITTGCNLRCAGCQRTLGMQAGTWTNRHMPVDRFSRILDHAPKAQVLVLQGVGEPTLHPDLAQLCAIGRDSDKFDSITFNTNGLAQPIEYFRDLRAHGLSHLSLSVDSLHPLIAQAARTGTDCTALRQMIGDLLDLFGKGLTISVLVSRATLDGLESLLADLAYLGAGPVELQPLVSYGPSTDGLRLTEQDSARVRAIIAQAQNRHPGLILMASAALRPSGHRCRRPFHAPYVTVDGFLTPCCLTEDTALLGNASLEHTAFADLWHQQGVADWYNRYLDRQPDICKGCAFNPAGDGPATAQDRTEAFQAGQAALRENRLAEAERQFRQIAAAPVVVESLHELGLLRHRAGRSEQALPFLEAIVPLTDSPRLLNNLGSIFFKIGQQQKALAVLQNCLQRHPAYIPAYRSLSAFLNRLGRRGDAAAVLRRLVRSAIDTASISAVETEIKPLADLDDTDQVLLTANLLRAAGRSDLAANMLDVLLARDPGHLGAALYRTMAELPMAYATLDEISQVRAGYAARLEHLAEQTQRAPTARLIQGAAVAGGAKPFFLSYQGQNDRDLQGLYGRAVATMLAALPLPPGPPLTAPPQSGERIRVGFASGHWRIHSISKLFGGWVEHLDRQGFEVFLYDLNDAPPDATAQRLHHSADHLRHRLEDENAWISAIRADRLHALIYPEIGMEPLVVRLAARRLAPLQAMSWGHPVTCGLPSVDYYLTSDLMEPDNGQDHYGETLIRLPGLSLCYQPLPTYPERVLPRQALGLRDDALVYLCIQSQFKYHPADDDVLTAIAAQVPSAQFLFIGGDDLPRARLLKARLRLAFTAAGLDFQRHVVFTQPVAHEMFPALLRAGDVYLDSLGWSGGNTTLEAIANGLPIVTTPGPLMRGRHSAAILTQMGLADRISADKAAYIAHAVALSDPTLRQNEAQQVINHRDRLYGDIAPIRALEEFLRTKSAIDLKIT